MAEYLHGSDTAEQLRLEALAKLLGGVSFLPQLKPGMRLLDVGCGTGVITREAALQVAPGEVIGIDRQEAQIEAAKRWVATNEIRNLQYKLGDAETLPFQDDQFDGVYCRFLLEHVKDPKKVVSEMCRAARPGAWVCACEWEADCLVNYPESKPIEQTWHGIYCLQERVGGDPWIARRLYGIFKNAGLTQVRVEGRAWTISAEQKERMQLYVDGAREIIRQTSNRLLTDRLLTQDILQLADSDYGRLLRSPTAFVLHAFCCATGTKATA
jgi:ubiquinone/menaquinone biosynthesis C-methylase UbiE